MDTLSRYRDIIEQVLSAHANTPSSIGDLQFQTVFDRDNDHYLIVQVGWTRQKRVYGTLGHVDLVGEKVWIQHDGTEDGLANQLCDAGIPAIHIVLGYRIPEVRRHTGFAVA
jgi:hypothetical protein